MKTSLLMNTLAAFALLGLAGGAGAADIKQAAKDVRDGKAKVGKVYSMDKTTRYHTVHTKVVGLNCQACHSEEYPADLLLVGRDKALPPKHPGPVDRAPCLACHRGGGPGRLLYGQAFSE